jgi:hypothetical protein
VASVDSILGNNQLEGALKQIDLARTIFSKLGKYTQSPAVTTFMVQGPALILAASDKCDHHKLAKEVEDKKSAFNTRLVVGRFLYRLQSSKNILYFIFYILTG